MKDACTIHRTKNPGNGSVAIRDDGKVCAVGGWDGKWVSAISLHCIVADFHDTSESSCTQPRLSKLSVRFITTRKTCKLLSLLIHFLAPTRTQ